MSFDLYVFPLLEDDPDGSPWSITPHWEPTVGGGAGFAVQWSCAESMRTALLEIADRTNVIVYDPQAGLVFLPGGVASR